MEMVGDVCRSTVSCHAEAIPDLYLLVLSGMVAVFMVATILHVTDARRLVSMERSRTAAERDAFAEFARRVVTIDADASRTQTASPTGSIMTVTARGRSTDTQLQQVEDAYRDTVLAVPHYDEEYGESLTENLTAEFGNEVAVAFDGGSQLTPQLKHALIQKSHEAERKRAEFLNALDREAAALDRSSETLSELDETLEGMDTTPLPDRTFEDLVETWERLGELRTRCEKLLTDRQSQVHAEQVGTRGDHLSLREYLYGSLPVTNPVLADSVDLTERLRTAQSRVVMALTARV